jgi:hypothetical protein
MKPFVYLLTALALISTAEAKKGKNGGNNEKAKQEEAKKKKEREERASKRDAVKEFLDKKDGNNDGSLTLDEYLVGESSAEQATKRFNEYNKNGDRYLSKKEIEQLLGL